MTTSWNLEHRSGTQRFTATFPEQTFPQELGSFVELADAAGSRLYARVAKRRGARGSQVWVSPGSLANTADGDPVSATPATYAGYLWYRLFHDWSLILALFGFIVAFGAVLVDDILPLLLPSATTAAWQKAFLALLKITGSLIALLGVFAKLD